MRRYQANKKMIAMFVLAFLCLKVGGAFCLTYCTQIVMASSPSLSDDSHLSEHCRKAKQEAEKKDKNSTKITADEASCCMMPVSMFAAPVEKQTRATDIMVADSAQAVNVDFYRFAAPRLAISHIASTPVYRPPPLDRRVERILNSVIRI